MRYLPPLPIDWAHECRSGIWSWIFQWLGKSLILKKRFIGRCREEGLGSLFPYGGSQQRGDSLNSSGSPLQMPFKGGQSSWRRAIQASYKSSFAAYIDPSWFLDKAGLTAAFILHWGKDRLNLFWQAGLVLRDVAALLAGVAGSVCGFWGAGWEPDCCSVAQGLMMPQRLCVLWAPPRGSSPDCFQKQILRGSGQVWGQHCQLLSCYI